MTTERPAIVLLSGGLDSATTLAICKQEGFRPLALSFAYGQRQHVELEAASRVARALGAAEHRFVKLDLASLGGSALTDGSLAVPKDRAPDEVGAGIPSTYVPARNTIFLAHALAWAEVVRAFDIFVGVNAVDYSGYPDCRPEFVAAFEQMANRALAATVEGRGTMRVHAPLMSLTKADIIRRGTALGVDFALTHSCYDPVGSLACGRCDSCQLRRAGFVAAAVPDPTRYVQRGGT